MLNDPAEWGDILEPGGGTLELLRGRVRILRLAAECTGRSLTLMRHGTDLTSNEPAYGDICNLAGTLHGHIQAYNCWLEGQAWVGGTIREICDVFEAVSGAVCDSLFSSSRGDVALRSGTAAGFLSDSRLLAVGHAVSQISKNSSRLDFGLVTVQRIAGVKFCGQLSSHLHYIIYGLLVLHDAILTRLLPDKSSHLFNFGFKSNEHTPGDSTRL